MIDIHAHILPGMDDGAEDLQDTLEMARMAVDNGTTVMVATPHCNLPGIYDNYFDKNYKDTFQRVVRALEEHNIPLTLLPGLEVFATPDLPELIADGAVQTINGSRYLLIEFPFEEEVEYSIVGTNEADPMKNKISDKSPIGSELINKTIGDEIIVNTPAGELKLKILHVERTKNNG